MTDWYKDKKWKKYYPSKNIYIMRDHNWAFAAWEIERIKGNIRSGSILLHVDAHVDFNDPEVEIDPLAYTSIEQALKTAEKLGHASFIQAGVLSNVIDKVYMISDDGVKISEENVVRSYTLTHFEHEHRMSLVHELETKQCILNIDLDYFNINCYHHPKNYDDNPNLLDDQVIYKQLEYFRDYQNGEWDLITVALSPEHCGGLEACKHIFDLFLDVFKLKELEPMDW